VQCYKLSTGKRPGLFQCALDVNNRANKQQCKVVIHWDNLVVLTVSNNYVHSYHEMLRPNGPYFIISRQKILLFNGLFNPFVQNGLFQKRSTLSPRKIFLLSRGGGEKNLFLIIVSVLRHPSGVGSQLQISSVGKAFMFSGMTQCDNKYCTNYMQHSSREWKFNHPVTPCLCQF
jgi:hypothetical protein